MFDDLVKRLRNAVEFLSQDMWAGGLFADAADAIEDLSGAIECYERTTDMALIEEDGMMVIKFLPKWIRVTERLPEDNSDILAYMEDANHRRFMAANYDHGYWQDCVTNLLYRTEEGVVTHWIPLPSPPDRED